MAIFTISALLELAMGIALLLFPGAVLALIFQADPDNINNALSRLCGVALVSLGLASRAVYLDVGSHRWAPGLIAYNLGVAFLFVSLHFSGIEKSLMFWPVAAVHLLIGGLMIVTRSHRAKGLVTGHGRQFYER